MNRWAWSFVRGVQGLVRMCRSPSNLQALANVFEMQAGPLPEITRLPSIPRLLNQATARARKLLARVATSMAT